MSERDDHPYPSMCSTDPAQLRDVVAETVRARAQSWTGGWESSFSPVASLFSQPPAAVLKAAVSGAAAGTAGAAGAGAAGAGAAGATADSGGGGVGDGVAGMAAKAAAAAGMPGVGAAINKGAAMDIPEDPEGAVADYVEQAMLKIPDEILGVIFRNALFGPSAMLFVGVLLLLLAQGASGGGGGEGEGNSSESGSSAAGGFMSVAGALLVGFGLFGVMTAYITYWLSRTMLHTMLHALVQQQVAAVRKTKEIFTDFGNTVTSTLSSAFSYGSAEKA